MSVLLDALVSVGELLDLADLISGRLAGTTNQQCMPTPRRAWWPAERNLGSADKLPDH